MVKDIQLLDCFQPGTFALERVRYFQRQLLTVEDMVTEQDYFRQKMRRHNRYLHGWGVVCGLQVTAAPGDGAPWRVQIGGGYALGPYGDEIYVAKPVFFDLARCGPGAHTDPCEPGLLHGASRTGRTLFVAIKYSECHSLPVRAMPPGCGCDETDCEYSRVRDSFEIGCLSDPPPPYTPPRICDLLRQRLLAPCPPCPTEPWLVLARVILPASPTASLPESAIDNFTFRRQLFSTSMLQEQLIRCCCGDGEEPTLAHVTSIVPANNAVISAMPSPSLTINITFDKDLQPPTVNASTITVQGFRSNQPVPNAVTNPNVTYNVSNRTAHYTANFQRDLEYRVTVRGDAPAIMDVDNFALDGDHNNAAGGNFTSRFFINLGPEPPA